MNLNKVFLLGNLTKNLDLRHTQGGTSVCSFGTATNRVYTDANGQKQNQPEFHNVVAWGKTGETIAQYMTTGSLIMVEGETEEIKRGPGHEPDPVVQSTSAGVEQKTHGN